MRVDTSCNKIDIFDYHTKAVIYYLNFAVLVAGSKKKKTGKKHPSEQKNPQFWRKKALFSIIIHLRK